jgi:hypothetical protein
MTYRELKAVLDSMTAEQLQMPATTYSGDIDEALPIFGTTINTDENMGDSLPGFDTNQIFLLS